MKIQAFILAIGLIIVFSIGARVSSDDAADDVNLAMEVQRLREAVGQLQRHVEYLMIDHRMDASDMDSLSMRVRNAEGVQAHVQALFQVGGQGGEGWQVHRSNRELRLALARLAFAKKDYDISMKQFDAASAASQMLLRILENRRDAGTVDLSDLFAAQQGVADIQLEKNRVRRKIAVLIGED